MGARPKVISLFSGCGGSSLGYKWAGFDELLAIDFDKNSVETFKLNFPGVPVWQRDICGVSGKEILDFCKIREGDLDLLDASPPCQGFSIAGKRKVLDTRNNLFLEFVRLIKEIKPKAFLMENVPGMMRGKMKGVFIEVMETLKGIDYNVKCRLMNSASYGVPQSRRRLIWIGTRKDLKIDPSFPKPNKKYITVREAFEGLKDSGEKKYPTGELAEIVPKIRQGRSGQSVTKKDYFNVIRLRNYAPSNTILKTMRSAQAGLLHPTEDRFLTIAELKRLSTFPDDFRFVGKFEQQWAGIGNAVMPKFMEAIATHIREEILQKAENIIK